VAGGVHRERAAHAGTGRARLRQSWPPSWRRSPSGCPPAPGTWNGCRLCQVHLPLPSASRRPGRSAEWSGRSARPTAARCRRRCWPSTHPAPRAARWPAPGRACRCRRPGSRRDRPTARIPQPGSPAGRAARGPRPASAPSPAAGLLGTRHRSPPLPARRSSPDPVAFPGGGGGIDDLLGVAVRDVALQREAGASPRPRSRALRISRVDGLRAAREPAAAVRRSP